MFRFAPRNAPLVLFDLLAGGASAATRRSGPTTTGPISATRPTVGLEPRRRKTWGPMRFARIKGLARTFFQVGLISGLLVAPAMGQNYCKKVFDDFIPSSQIPPNYSGSVLLRLETFDIYTSKGKYVGTFKLTSTLHGEVAITLGGAPYSIDPIGNPNGVYNTQDTLAIMHSFCPGGITRAVSGPSSLPGERPKTANAASTAPPSGQAAGSFAEGDFNGDGIPDSVSTGFGKVIVNLYNSAGQVGAVNVYNVGVGNVDSGPILAADFNGDGVLDLAVLVTPSSISFTLPQGNLAILLGKGDGTFGAPVYFPAGSSPGSLAAADFNGDSKLDLAVGNTTAILGANGYPNGSAGSISILLRKGDGTFPAPASYSVGASPESIVATDFNGDGYTDLAILDAGYSTGPTQSNALRWVLLGNGNGTFRTPIGGPAGTGTGSLSYADLNRDGKEDLIVADFDYSAIAGLMGNGDGTFQPAQSHVAGAQPVSVGVIPLGDGNTALFTADNVSGSLVVNLAASNGHINGPALQMIGTQPAAVAVADLNGDGKPDIVWTDTAAGPSSCPRCGGALYVLLKSGGGLFAAPVTYSVGGSTGATAVADVNHDGKPDLIVLDGNGIEVLLGKGDGTFGTVQASPAPAGPNSVIAVADFNSDGKADLAVLSCSVANCGFGSSGSVSILLGNGNGTFSLGTSIPLPGGAIAGGLVAADFNGDGKTDLAVSYGPQDPTQPGAAVTVLLGDGHGAFHSSAVIPMSAGGLAAADLNKDGKLDLLARVTDQSTFSRYIAVALGKGDGTFQPLSLTQTATAGPGIVVADLDRDGNADLVLSDCCGLTESLVHAGQWRWNLSA